MNPAGPSEDTGPTHAVAQTAQRSAGIAALFVFAMAAFIGGLTVFLREIFLAVASTRGDMR